LRWIGPEGALESRKASKTMPSLPETHYSLLARLVEPGDAAAWSEFTSIYEEAILRYSRNRGLQEADAQEVVQHVLLAVHQAIGDWHPTGRPGSFRAWLARTAHHVCSSTLRDRQKCDRATGGTSVVLRLGEIEDRNSAVGNEDRDWQQWAFCWAAGQVQREVAPATWRAFWLTAVDGLSPGEVAAQLGIKTGSVYASKCRVLARIRERLRELSREGT
jgi:RNA polymerase sigma-70 factor (ECF subfamily)